MTHCICEEWKKKKKKLDYITIGIIDISQYTVPHPESFSGGGGGAVFLVYWHLKLCHGGGWGAENFMKV